MLSYSEMPISITAHFMNRAIHSSWLIHDGTNSIYAKGAKNLSYAIYAIGVSLLAPWGSIYHGCQAFKNKIYSLCIQDSKRGKFYSKLAWEHLKASFSDLDGIAQLLKSTITLNGMQSAIHVLSATVSHTTVKVDSQKDEASASTKKFIADLPKRATESTAWGVQAYQNRVCKAYCFAELIVQTAKIRNACHQSLALNDVTVLKGVQIDNLESSCLEGSIVCYPNQLTKVSDAAASTKPVYRMPWISIAFVVAAVATVVFTGLVFYGLFLSGLLLPGVLIGSFVSTLISALLVLLSINSYVVSCGRDELDHAKKLLQEFNEIDSIEDNKYEEALYWIQRAAERGYASAQRLYGLTLMASAVDGPADSYFQEGFQWLVRAAANPTVLFPGEINKDFHCLLVSNIENSAFSHKYNDLPSSAKDRFVNLFKGVDTKKVAESRLRDAFAEEKEKGIDSLIKKARRAYTANRLIKTKVKVFIPDIAEKIATFLI